ncbi:FAD-dependent oxidoreductase [Ktedonobacter robiniae]|uniref:FAD/NAD(P)-binding domain-containing protein n=1 Tax=Ktedonobacter robiniae TaxID=2778365 RepID=A0ABQ3UTV3_9CHLR|nr:FAD-dependent oxidoreductase [Ktedonobacter robiniae]GHO55810.1 hypothetical protein KSB_42850 [Ktedonobacter robiniae]
MARYMETKKQSLSSDTKNVSHEHMLLIPRLRGQGSVYEERIAIIGSGPVGLAAANILFQYGYCHVTIFDANPTVGGVLAMMTPSFGVSPQAGKQLIEMLLRPGIEVRLHTKIGREVMFEQILQDFDATLLAVGAQHGLGGGIPGEKELQGVFSALDILRNSCAVKKRFFQGSIAILGGSRAAFEVAAVVLQAGARVVHIFYPGPLSELPLQAWNRVTLLKKELYLHPFTMPISLIGTEDMNICGLHCRQTRWIYEEKGRRLAFVPGYGRRYPAETVIIAIEEVPDLSFLPPSMVISRPSAEELRLVDVLTTPLPGVFAAGDVMANMKSLYEAFMQGEEAAHRIHVYLRRKAEMELPAALTSSHPLMTVHE